MCSFVYLALSLQYHLQDIQNYKYYLPSNTPMHTNAYTHFELEGSSLDRELQQRCWWHNDVTEIQKSKTSIFNIDVVIYAAFNMQYNKNN